jgi:hypothetical protein
MVSRASMTPDEINARIVLTAEELLAGNAMTFDVIVPPHTLRPGVESDDGAETIVRLRPLTFGTFMLILKAAKDDDSLIPLLMIQESVVEPKLSVAQLRQMHLGLISFLIAHVRQISGLTEKKSP